MTSNTELLTADQVAKRLQVKYKTILSWLASGKLKGKRIGNRLWRISQADLEEFINNGS